jgi:hypothetical protein
LASDPDGGFVQVAAASGEPPYHITLGDSGATGYATFYFHGVHHTEILRWCLLPLSLTREVTRNFLETGTRSTKVPWGEV